MILLVDSCLSSGSPACPQVPYIQTTPVETSVQTLPPVFPPVTLRQVFAYHSISGKRAGEEFCPHTKGFNKQWREWECSTECEWGGNLVILTYQLANPSKIWTLLKKPLSRILEYEFVFPPGSLCCVTDIASIYEFRFFSLGQSVSFFCALILFSLRQR